MKKPAINHFLFRIALFVLAPGRKQSMDLEKHIFKRKLKEKKGFWNSARKSALMKWNLLKILSEIGRGYLKKKMPEKLTKKNTIRWQASILWDIMRQG